MSQQVVERDIIAFLNANGFYAWRNQSGQLKVGRGWVHFAPKGVSDVIGLHKSSGRIVAIERKRPNEPSTPEQDDFLEMVRRAGGYAGIARTIQDVAEIIGKNPANPHHGQ